MAKKIHHVFGSIFFFFQPLSELYTLLFWRADISQSKREKIDNAKTEYFKKKMLFTHWVGKLIFSTENDFKLFEY